MNVDNSPVTCLFLWEIYRVDILKLTVNMCIHVFIYLSRCSKCQISFDRPYGYWYDFSVMYVDISKTQTKSSLCVMATD